MNSESSAGGFFGAALSGETAGGESPAGTLLGGALSTLSRIDLLTVQTAADLQTRVDRKYVVPPGAVHRVISELEAELCVLEIDGARQSRYESVYFDTPALDCYRAAAHGRRHR